MEVCAGFLDGGEGCGGEGRRGQSGGGGNVDNFSHLCGSISEDLEMDKVVSFLVVGIGGAAGSMLRYGATLLGAALGQRRHDDRLRQC